MAFKLPSDDEIRRIFGLLSQEDTDETNNQFDEDVAKEKHQLSKQNNS